ncbi:MAG: PilC/PilY family type IV pilus protein, partial [Gammaproteobacteria bacterium]
MNIPSRSALAHVLLAALFVVMPLQQAQSAPGALPSSPLFLSTIVEPNVFFTLDDSGSMDWGPMVEEGTAGLTTDGGLPYIDARRRAYYSPTFSRLYTARYVLPPADGTLGEWDRGWVVRTHHGNLNYYNPAITYAPWAGTQADGSPMYTDANPQAALKDPNLPGGESMDLTIYYTFSEMGNTSNTLWVPTYFIWIDTDLDGVIEQTDARTRIEIAAGTPEMQNFANWFVYYRSRVNATKAAIGRVINNTDASRMGFSGFNFGHLKDLETMTDPQLKRELLEVFYGVVIPARGTPARNALADVGQMFQSTTSGAILSAALGGECQQNFNILMSDGFWNGQSPSVGNTDQDTSGVTDNGFDGDANESVDDGNYEDTYSNTLADVAMNYYEIDLRTDLNNRVPVTAGVDEADHQHMVTYTISFGLNGTLDSTTVSPLDIGFSWPDAFAGDAEKVDDLWHAAYNGRGRYLSAQNPAQLQASLNTAISDIAQRTSTAAAVAVNSARLSTESVVYLGQFNTNRWQGNLFAFPIIDLNTGELATTAKWDASTKLTQRDISVNPRTILTYDKSAGVADGVPFQWANLSIDMQADLRTNPAGSADTIASGIGQARLDYIRGDRSNEGTGFAFRERASLLGDLVNSGPVFVGAPNLDWPDFAPFPTGIEAYSEFKNSSLANRQKIVYVGANDGMLHAFNDDTGDEIFAYIPGPVYSQTVNRGLHYLSDPNYLHQYYVDLTPSLSDIFITGAVGGSWTTVLIGGMRAGGRGYFALDVTDPSTFSEANAADMVLWEFTSDDDADLGFSYSRPFIALTNAGTWVAIFGNGYNDTGSGEAQLFIVDIAKGIDGAWSATDYKKLSTKVGTSLDPNGLATPALADLDGNGTVDRVYAGDLQGNMWVFDLSSANAANWAVAYKSGATPMPLFTTQGNEPITAKPVLASHPTQPDSNSPSNAPNIMVYFGSGQYLVDADKSSTDVQSFYGVWD